MSWSCTLKGKNNIDLLKKYNVNPQFLGLASNCEQDYDGAAYRLIDIRAAFDNIPYKNKLDEAAQDAVLKVKQMLNANLASLKEQHCKTCKCDPAKTEGWDMEQIKRFLAIPIEEIKSASSSY